MKKNTNRTSIIKGQIVDAQEFKFEAFEIETEYTRSTFKAAQLVADAMNLEAGRYMVHVTEIINEPVKAIEYDAQSLFDFALNVDTVNDFEPTETQKVIEFTAYVYSGQIWAVSGEDYKTENYEVERNVKLTKVDQRAIIAMCYEKEYENWRVLGVHNVTREPVQRFALIENEALANVKTK